MSNNPNIEPVTDDKTLSPEPVQALPSVDPEGQVTTDMYEKRAIELGTVTEVTEEDRIADKKLLRKIDLHIMPILFCSYGLQYMDKIGITSGAAFNLIEDTHLVGQDFAWLTTGFYLAYLAAEFPVNALMQRYPIDRVLAYCVVFWGICVFGMAACKNFTQLLVCRLLLGAGEAAVLPGFLIIITAWYTKAESHWRSTIFFCANPIFAFWCLMVFYALGLNSTAIAGWRAINLFLGALSVTWAVIVYFFLCTPKNARWLTPEERARAHARLVVSQAGESESGIAIKWDEVKEAFLDPMVWFSLGFSMLYCLSSGGISAFSTIILKDAFQLSGAQSIAYQIPFFASQLVSQGGAGYICHRYQNKNVNLLCCIGCLVPTIIGIFLMALLENDKKWARIIGFWICGFFTANIYIVWAQNGLNVAGRTKKSTVQAMVFCVFAIGYLIGPQAYQAKDAPKYYPGLYFAAACYSCMAIVALIWRWFTIRENARRDRIVAASGMTKEAAEMEGRLNGVKGLTDRQNIHFRYRY